jgi:hypothetical protein
LTVFQAHLELLQVFLARRHDIVEGIQDILNAQRQSNDYLQDTSLLSGLFEDCFFTLSALDHTHARLRGQLEDAHWASGFKPRALPGLYNGLVDPAEMMVRAFHLWQQTRWPGRNGRVRYAHTLFNLYLVRRLELLSMRAWDDDPTGAGARIAQLQSVLDRLWNGAAADQPVLLRDARWLIPLAQSPATDDLEPYFNVAERIAEALSDDDRIEIHTAGVRMAAGHLRSQIRYHSLRKAVRLDEHGLVLSTRSTNALDFALLIQDLVPLLEAYERAARAGDDQTRLELADTICQGVSPDPELFLLRVDLLAAYSMIEHLFITTDRDGRATYTPMGRRHVRLLQDYQALIGRVAKALHDDCSRFRPVDGAYSPYGALYGFASNLMEHMALKALQPDAVTRFSVEDVFAAGDSDKLAWVTGWRKLPHLKRDVEAQFDYPQHFAEEMFQRVERALRSRASGGEVVAKTGRLLIVATDAREIDSTASQVPDLPARYIQSSDDRRLLGDRREGRCLVSYETSGGWVAVSKTVLTEVLGAGQDATLAGLPPVAAQTLKLMCPALVVL